MKRAAAAWVCIDCNDSIVDRVYWNKALAEGMNTRAGRRVVPCIITYDDGRKPKRKGKAKP